MQAAHPICRCAWQNNRDPWPPEFRTVQRFANKQYRRAKRFRHDNIILSLHSSWRIWCSRPWQHNKWPWPLEKVAQHLDRLWHGAYCKLILSSRFACFNAEQPQWQSKPIQQFLTLADGYRCCLYLQLVTGYHSKQKTKAEVVRGLA
jgi:hypothetical protein